MQCLIQLATEREAGEINSKKGGINDLSSSNRKG